MVLAGLYIIGALLICCSKRGQCCETLEPAVKLGAPPLRDRKIIIDSDSQMAMFKAV